MGVYVVLSKVLSVGDTMVNKSLVSKEPTYELMKEQMCKYVLHVK